MSDEPPITVIAEYSALKTKIPQRRKIITLTYDDDATSQTEIPDEDEEAGEDECTSDALLVRQTSSFRCMQQLVVSDSSLLKNPLYYFPPIEDPGIDEAFNFVEPEPVYDNIGVDKYKDMCSEYRIVPLKKIINSLSTDQLNLKYYGLTETQVEALMEALKSNVLVKELTLEDNRLSLKSMEYLSEMLKENITIEVLNMKECRIGEEGAKYLNEALLVAPALRELDLSFNDLEDNGIFHLKTSLSSNPVLKKLDLSHNNLTEDSAEPLADIITNNTALEELNLRWNNFSTGAGNKILFNGFKLNQTIKKLNLAWNGIELARAVMPIRQYVAKSTALEYLDMSNNLLAGRAFRNLRMGVNRNKTLIELKIGNNIFTPKEALLFAKIMIRKVDDPIQVIDMENMMVEKEFLQTLDKIRSLKKDVRIGGVLSNFKIIGPNSLKLLFDRCRYLLMKPKKKKMKKDFGHFILTLPDKPVTQQEFDEALHKRKMKALDKDLLLELKSRFEGKKHRIDSLALKAAYLELYPDATPPPVKPKKKKREAKGKKGKKKKKTDETGEKPGEGEQVAAEEVVEKGSITDIEDYKKSFARSVTKSLSKSFSKSLSLIADRSQSHMRMSTSRGEGEGEEPEGEKEGDLNDLKDLLYG